MLLDSEASITNISISDDAGYLIFSFQSLNKEFHNCIGCDELEHYLMKIGVAELIKK